MSFIQGIEKCFYKIHVSYWDRFLLLYKCTRKATLNHGHLKSLSKPILKNIIPLFLKPTNTFIEINGFACHNHTRIPTPNAFWGFQNGEPIWFWNGVKDIRTSSIDSEIYTILLMAPPSVAIAFEPEKKSKDREEEVFGSAILCNLHKIDSSTCSHHISSLLRWILFFPQKKIPSFLHFSWCFCNWTLEKEAEETHFL